MTEERILLEETGFIVEVRTIGSFIEKRDSYLLTCRGDDTEEFYDKLRSQILQDHEIVNRLRERIEDIYRKYAGVNEGLSEEEIYLVEQTLPELQKIMENKK